MDINRVAERFNDFALLECEGSSELYKNLALQVAKDEDLLELCLFAREGQPIPNLLFGTVHYLLLQGNDDELAKYYPSINEETKEDRHLFPAFKKFCFDNVNEIMFLLKNKLVQTNEVRRCAYLYPLFCYIHQQTNKPLSLIEVGTSAGLQLMWDHYAYSYDSHDVYGKKDSFVHLTSKIREGRLPRHLLSLTPPVKDRIGIDLHVSDLTEEEDYLWLKALIWPEHKDRLANFDRSVKQLRITPPHLIEGDGVGLLAEIVEEIRSDSTLCIFHTHVANQMPPSVKENLLNQIANLGKQRDIYHIYNNMDDRMLHIDSIVNGKMTKNTVGETDGHGRWFDWNLCTEIL